MAMAAGTALNFMRAGMRPTKKKLQEDTWDPAVCDALIAQLWALRTSLLKHETALQSWLEQVDPSYRASARNLAHYLALRQKDWRPLQEKLARIGVSRLGRAESNVLANLDKILGILHRLTGQSWQERSADEPVGIHSSQALLEQHTTELLGKPATTRSVRIMVTLPSETAQDFGSVRKLILAGMDIARINCAHDGPQEWIAMAASVRRAAKAAGRPVHILMDLAGPKLRTGAVTPGPAVLKLRPKRDLFGKVLEPAHLLLQSSSLAAAETDAAARIVVDSAWLEKLKPGDRLELKDARGAARSFAVSRREAEGVWAECVSTVYLIPETRLKLRRKGRRLGSSWIAGLPSRPGSLQLARGTVLRLTRDPIDMRAADAAASPPRHARVPSVACTLPEIFEQVSVGERVFFDDGRIGGVIRRVTSKWLEVEITQARDKGEKLAGDKGINFPDSRIDLPALTEKDIADLGVVAKLADLVGLSFVQCAGDIRTLREHLQKQGAPKLGIVLKIETRRSFENLPELMFAAMEGKAAGVMIARGDLAVECGYERLAEVQEEILWAAEATHMPVIWATQVLETLAKTGLPSRAEITDAAMGERAECVMLNKGPYITDAMRTLDDILRRMQAHQTKKRPLLRALTAWVSADLGHSSENSAAAATG